MTTRASLTIEQHADLIDGLISHCRMISGELAAETHITLTESDIHDLDQLATRLRRIAPYEDRIKQMVLGK